VVGSSSELVDVVDEEDRVLGVVTRSEVRARNLLHRGTFIVVFSKEGKLLVHQRASHKDVWPSRWDIAVGGVVTSGEDYLQSARREVAEEIGVVDELYLEEIGSGIFEDDEVRVLGRCYLLRSDGPFTFADGEIVEALLVTAEELRDKLATEKFVPDSLAIVGPLLAGDWARAINR
jgi:isopentenyldiphosphate isomerase